MDELTNPEIPECALTQIQYLKDSSDVGPEDWALYATIILESYYNYDGFVILHGTDTMAYTASALSE